MYRLFIGLLSAYFGVTILIVLVFTIAGWRLFSKAGKPGWAIVVPFYNLYIYTQIIKRPGWWILLYFSIAIPAVGALGIVFLSIIDQLRLAKVFGRSEGFGVGLILLGWVFFPILAFSESHYDPNRIVEGELI
ncbi:MAG: signal peptidase I [Flavobacteriales bacterium]|nr:signal peptidase I [Flavobacteriales bacterium]